MLSTDLGRFDNDLYAATALLGSALAVLGLTQVLRQPSLRRALADWTGVAPPFINVIGVLFGLTLAFIANDTWNAQEQAIQTVHHQAQALHSIVTLSEPLDAPVRERIQAASRASAMASAQEWSFLAKRTVSPLAESAMQELLSACLDPAIEHARGTGLAHVLAQLAAQADAERAQRIAISQIHVNPLKWLGMGFLGLLTLLSVAAVHVHQPRAASLSMVLFALAAAPIAAVVLVQANPFERPCFVSAEPLVIVAGSPPRP